MNIRYIENKLLDESKINHWLKYSADANHWTNFGPVSKQLEAKLHQQLALSDDLRVVACANATIALHTLAIMHQCIAGRELKWATSSFGFYSSVDGVLHDAQIIDCDQNAMLDLSKIDPDTIDGLIVTNVFGQEKDVEAYKRYAQQHNKLLIIDSAMGVQPSGHIANECISLHHTKPWGFGEGGCAIIDADNEELFRSLISFGHDVPSDTINRLAINGKISDIACAYILMRLEQMETLKPIFLQQYQRIAALGLESGFSILADVTEHPGVPASVPLLFPTSTELMENCEMPVRRYYHPLAPTEKATDIYSRIVNVPCHPEIAQFSDSHILQALQKMMTHSLSSSGVSTIKRSSDRALEASNDVKGELDHYVSAKPQQRSLSRGLCE